MSLPQASTPSAMHFDNTLGALYVGAQLSALLLGITSVQVYMYYSHSPRDSMAFKMLITFLWMLDALHAVFFSESFYHYGVTNFLNPVALLSPTWSLVSDILAGDLSNIIVSMIFVRRIWLLSNRGIAVKLAMASITLLSVVIAIGAISIMAIALSVSTFVEFNARCKWIWYATFCSRAVVDITIAAVLCIILWTSRTTFSRTKSLIHTLMLYTINTGVLTASVAIIVVATFAAFPNTFISFGATVLLPKLMFNSLLALLNSRDSLREKVLNAPNSIHVSRMPFTTAEEESDTPQEIIDISKPQSFVQGDPCIAV